MKAPLAALSLGCCLALALPTAAEAQDGSRAGRPSLFGRGKAKPAPAAAPASTAVDAEPADKVDTNVVPANNVPTPAMIGPGQGPTLALPNEPIEPWLLTKDAGPFMVLARSFRGPDAERCALALAKELRTEYRLPTFILRTKDFPGKSNIRDIPPTAPEFIREARLTDPERVRSYDEAAVLVGNAKTEEEAKKLLHEVRKIRPTCLNEIPSVFNWRQGLSQATRTTNPYVPTQNIFPGRKKDAMVAQMNAGPRSIYNCPGRYTLQVAEFSGRSSFNFNTKEKDAKFLDNNWLKKSPLMTAADDAEKLAETLAKDPEVRQTGFQPYVYHDRTSSKVMVGSFNAPTDPAAQQLRERLLNLAVPLSARKRAGMIIAPANQLTDLQDQQNPIKTQ